MLSEVGDSPCTARALIANLARYLPAATVVEFNNRKGRAGENGEMGTQGLVAILRRGRETVSAELARAVGGADVSPQDSDIRFQAQRLFLRRCKSLYEYGATFYVAGLLKQPTAVNEHQNSRARAGSGGSTGEASSEQPSSAPSWQLDATTVEPAATTEMERLPVLVAIGQHGVLLRPLPPVYTASENFESYRGDYEQHITGVDAAQNKRSLAMMRDYGGGVCVPWDIHGVQHIEVWGTKRNRPVFTYAVKNRHEKATIELQSPQFKEMSGMLHCYVFALLTVKENQPRLHARLERSDYGLDAKAARLATRTARFEAESDLPNGWSEIRDPVTGAVAFWNQFSKKILWARPKQ